MTNRARIYRQPKTAMQSGMAGCEEWILDFEPAEARRADPLMGWSGSADTQTQVRLRFASREEAVAFARRVGWPAISSCRRPAASVPRPMPTTSASAGWRTDALSRRGMAAPHQAG